MNAHRVEARRWFRQAKADLEVVRSLRSSQHYAAACFHSQQAAEKAL
jgi:HEPN domain-containing protein